MSLKPLKITFEMDSKGVIAWPNDLYMLDGLMSWALLPMQPDVKKALERDDNPGDVSLPLGKWEINNHWGWHASALFFKGETLETTQYFRKRNRYNRSHLTQGVINGKFGRYREYNAPLPVILCRRMIAYALGSKKRVKSVLRLIKYIGAKRSYGYGRIKNISIDIIEEDNSIFDCEGRPMRYLPDQEGQRMGRIRPPYHNKNNWVKSCFVEENNNV
jgi:hypothetical protein